MKNDLQVIKGITSPELTTPMLLGILSSYADPRKKINTLTQKGVLKHIKQGVYLLTEDAQLRPYSKEILANLLYGPSYISLETALSFYGFIPERPTTTTSVCLGRGKSFSTIVGDFEYYHLKDSLYHHGVRLRETFPNTFFQMASPEKVLLDFLYFREKKGEFKNPIEYFNYIVESYRLDLKSIKATISKINLQKLGTLYTSSVYINWFTSELSKSLRA